MTRASLHHFAEHDWNFHKIPEDEFRVAWLWELDRTLGSGGTPWLHLPDASKRYIEERLPESDVRVIEEWDLEKAHPEVVRVYRSCFHGELWRDGYHNLHMLDVDWSFSETRILERLKRWVRANRAKVPKSRRRENDRGGRKNQYDAWLVDLAMYRAGEAGLKHADAVNRMKPLFEYFTPCGTGKISQKHWKDPQKRTRERLAVRRAALVEGAKLWRDSGDICEWSDLLTINWMIRDSRK